MNKGNYIPVYYVYLTLKHIKNETIKDLKAGYQQGNCLFR